MIQNESSGIVFLCDKCPAILETEEHEFNWAIEVMKNNGWKRTLVNDEWQHFCAECK